MKFRKYDRPKKEGAPNIKVRMKTDHFYYQKGDVLTIYDSYISLISNQLVYRLQEVPGEYTEDEFDYVEKLNEI